MLASFVLLVEVFGASQKSKQELIVLLIVTAKVLDWKIVNKYMPKTIIIAILLFSLALLVYHKKLECSERSNEKQNKNFYEEKEEDEDWEDDWTMHKQQFNE